MLDAQLSLISRRIDEFDRFHTLRLRERRADRPALHEEIDAFVIESSCPGSIIFSGLGERWRETSRFGAHSILQRILSHDLAYDRPEIPLDVAVELATAFLGLFGPAARFFTNGRFIGDGAAWGGNGSVADATFETGVVAVDDSLIGILWCHDED